MGIVFAQVERTVAAMEIDRGILTRRWLLEAGVAGSLGAVLPLRLMAETEYARDKMTEVVVANEQGVKDQQYKAPGMEFCFELAVNLDAPLDLGETQQGHRRV